MFRLSLILMTVLSVGFASSADAGLSRFLPRRHKAPQVTAVQKKERARVEKDVQRLESILAGVKTSAKVSTKSLKSAANEATDLANRIYANVKSVTADKKAVQKAEQLRTHIQNMKKEAYKGDQKKTRQYANRALSVASQLDEWAG
jgi:formyltetrahydrofolate synthetase